MSPNPVQTLDSQIASAGNSIVEAIQASYPSKTHMNPSVVTNPTVLLSQRMPANKVPMPSKGCNISDSIMNSSNSLDLNKNIKSLSLDPIMRRLIQEKNDILRAIEGWIASCANDGARQPILGVSITKWIKKAIGYMRCGMQLIKQINQLVTSWINAINKLIGSIATMISDNIKAANMLIYQFQTLGDQLKKEGARLEALLVIYLLQDIFALQNELMAMEKELQQLKQQFSKDHLKTELVTICDCFLSLIEDFKQTCNRISNYRTMQTNLENAIVKLQASLDEINSLDLTVPLNPGGINPGSLSNFSMTNDSGLFSDYDSLTRSTLLNTINSAKVVTSKHGNLALWTPIFISNEPGYITFSSTDYGVFQLGLSYENSRINTGSTIMARLIINGGDWIIQAKITGALGEVDDTFAKQYATKNGVFIKVPEAPGPDMRMSVKFDEFIRAVNCGLTVGQSMIDPTQPILDASGNITSYTTIVVPSRYEDDGDYFVIDGAIPTFSDWHNLTQDDLHTINSLKRYPTQSEIDFYENQYISILQTLGVSATLYNADQVPQKYQYLGSALASSTFDLPVYLISPYDIKLHFTIPFDQQLKETLIGNRPFGGIQIYTTSLTFEIAREALLKNNIPYFNETGNSYKDLHVVSFGLKADWGFAPISQLS